MNDTNKWLIETLKKDGIELKGQRDITTMLSILVSKYNDIETSHIPYDFYIAVWSSTSTGNNTEYRRYETLLDFVKQNIWTLKDSKHYPKYIAYVLGDRYAED